MFLLSHGIIFVKCVRFQKAFDFATYLNANQPPFKAILLTRLPTLWRSINNKRECQFPPSLYLYNTCGKKISLTINKFKQLTF